MMFDDPKTIEELASKIVTVGNRAKNEEEVKIGIEKLLDKILRDFGLDLKPEYEKTIVRGFVDAVYGRVIIEYEGPKKLSSKAGHKEAVNQLMEYMLESSEITQIGSLTAAIFKPGFGNNPS